MPSSPLEPVSQWYMYNEDNTQLVRKLHSLLCVLVCFKQTKKREKNNNKNTLISLTVLALLDPWVYVKSKGVNCNNNY